MVSVFFQLGKECPFEKSENQFFWPKKINFDVNRLYLRTKTGLLALLGYYVIWRSVVGFYIPNYFSIQNFNFGPLKIV